MIIYNLAMREERTKIKDLLKKAFSSCHVNLLLGAGFSMPLLKGLNDIEENLTKSKEQCDDEKQAEILYQFFNQSIKPLLFCETEDYYRKARELYIQSICDIVAKRHSSVLHKMINIFTTNYDPLIENALENILIEYSDGFSGRISPTFSTSNYGKIISKMSSIENKTIETVTANLIKLHGSLNWTEKSNKITYENYKIKIETLAKHESSSKLFMNTYESSFAIVNPNKDKFNTTVLNSNYYDQLRILGNALEKNNTFLVVFGFSFNDEHLRAIIERALINPTLTICIFAFDKWSLDALDEKFHRFNNVILIRNDCNLNIEVASRFLEEINNEIR